MSTRSTRYRKSAILGITCALAGVSLAIPANGWAADEKVQLSGCLVKADGDGDPYLLTNAPAQPALSRSSSHDVAPSSVGTTGEFRTIFYWLDGDGDLKAHIGHRVEIEGDLKGDVKPGEIKLDRKDNWTEMSVKSNGRSLKARVPNLSVVPDESKHDELKANIAVRRVEVEHVKMLAASCEP